MNTGERWLPIPGFPGYDVSDQGRVRSSRQRWGPVEPHMLNPYLNRQGYPQVTLFREARPSSNRVHTLVALAFIGPYPDGLEIRHLDGNKTNNTSENLAYGTRSENMRDRIRHGVDPNASKTHCKRGHEFTPENTKVWPKGNRECRACAAERHRQAYRARVAASA